MLNHKIANEEVERLRKHIGKRVEVKSIDADYQFSEIDGDNVYCGGVGEHFRFFQVIREVNNDGITIGTAIDDVVRGSEFIPFASDFRYDGSAFLRGINSESYTIKMLAKIQAGDEIIFQKDPEDYMPVDLREKCKTHRSVPLPPPVDLDE